MRQGLHGHACRVSPLPCAAYQFLCRWYALRRCRVKGVARLVKLLGITHERAYSVQRGRHAAAFGSRLGGTLAAAVAAIRLRCRFDVTAGRSNFRLEAAVLEIQPRPRSPERSLESGVERRLLPRAWRASPSLHTNYPVYCRRITMATLDAAIRICYEAGEPPAALSPAVMTELRALVAARVGPSWMEWFDMTPGERAAALAAAPSLTP